MPVKKGNSIDFLTARDAYLLRKQRNLTHYRSLYGLIEFVEKRIHFTSSDGGCDTLVIVPAFTMELPPYDVIEMTDELLHHLTEHGYYVRRVGPNTIYVSWRNPTRVRDKR